MTTIREKLKFPSDEDLTGAAVALMRLQDTYKLDTASLARGELNGVQYSTQLSGNNQIIVHTETVYFYRLCLFLLAVHIVEILWTA